MPITVESGGASAAAAEIRIGCENLLIVTAALAAERREGGRASGSEAEQQQQQQSSSSSIGENSDRSGAGDRGSEDGGGEEEVQSAFERGALESFDGALEESLPMRRGISQYYRGKSKSFTSLADAASSSSSARDLAKPENAYSRKRKNLLAHKIMWENPRRSDPTPSSSCGGLLKRHTGLGRRSPALAGGDSGQDSTSSSNSSSMEELNQARLLLPPLHPLSKAPPSGAPPASGKCSFATRSFSLIDLQGIRSSSNPSD